MIGIVAKGQPLLTMFCSDYDEATSLLLFSKSYGLHDVFIFTVERDASFRTMQPSKYITCRELKKLLKQAENKRYEQLQIKFLMN